ncbi:cytochrome P450 [Lophium mytilinum]|uniref:Cytochrome P450 n=1 Tax=Lophium mytilinum TaxID=390894 RepID=A0A6A6QDG1_9PEZI|nr:cytochrome P450 [Lophium mytilinum]
MASNPPPQLPPGMTSSLRGISETYSFHASPEAFIASRVLAYQKEHPSLGTSQAIIRAKILNRNVAVVSSHAQITHILKSSDGYTAGAAYAELMAPFFPSPNLLLLEGEEHVHIRQAWEGRLEGMFGKVEGLVKRLTKEHFAPLANGEEVELYETLKTLSWKILLGVFISLIPEEDEIDVVEKHQETLLRGQFSLMPISVNAGFWHSPRKRGIDAKTRLQEILGERLKEDPARCPFNLSSGEQIDEAANHSVLFTSSLAAKAIASFMTALFLNIFFFPGSKKGFAATLANTADGGSCKKALRSIVLETERLSPPIVGIMRRSTQENTVPSPHDQPDGLIPSGWDVWLYFVGGGRDPTIYGDSWGRFEPGRYLDSDVSPAFAFGAGSKTCLGQHLIREIVTAVAEACLDMRLNLDGDVTASGVRARLGWTENDEVSPEVWAADMKQLPTQHPTKPVRVRISSGTS